MKTLDEVFDLLDRERRRFALYYLSERDGPVPVEELAEQVAAWETGTSPDEIPDGPFEDVTLTLVHQHLPRAANAEFVEYDREDGVVKLTGADPEFGIVLSVARAIEQPAEDDVMAALRNLI